jgi:pimeloyl-ACP methyl ester carboxylesterase
MWHGAWCWQPWQAFLAERGWESVAYSLPGHGKSPLQRSLTSCTLSYYLAFLRDEVKRLPHKPVLMGHSMGGALSQWVLRHVEPDLPAVVLVAPWVSHSSMADWPALSKIMAGDPLGMALMFVTWNASPWVRTPKAAAAKLLSQEAVVSPEDLQRQLVGESSLVILHHNPPFWKPAENVRLPMLLLAGEKDAVLSVESLRKSAAHYRADFVIIPGAGHNLMMEKTYLQTADQIDTWLNAKKIA